MRRLILCLLPAVAGAQVWEKPLAPGLLYRQEVDTRTPLVTYALRLSFGAPGVRAVPTLADGTVYGPPPLNGRGTVSAMARDNNAVGAMNADFFPLGGGKGMGDPLGPMVQDGELLSVPGQQRAVFAWGLNAASTGFVQWTATAVVAGKTVAVDGLNEETPLNRVILNTPKAGLAISKGTNVCLLVKTEESVPLRPDGAVSGQIVAIENDITSLPVPEGHVRLVLQGTRAALVSEAKIGDSVRVEFKATGFDWSRFVHAVGGGPMLLKDGQEFIDGKEEGFDQASFIDRRHPRTVVGRTPEGDVWWVVADGRTEVSRGWSLPEAAAYLRRLGCVDAINLDGGGSSVVALFGRAINRPSDGNERPVANGVTFYGPVQKGTGKVPRIVLRAVPGGYQASLERDKKNLPDREIVWSCEGDAWIDGGGFIRPLKGGKASVRAVWRGVSIEAVYPVAKEQAP